MIRLIGTPVSALISLGHISSLTALLSKLMEWHIHTWKSISAIAHSLHQGESFKAKVTVVGCSSTLTPA